MDAVLSLTFCCMHRLKLGLFLLVLLTLRPLFSLMYRPNGPDLFLSNRKTL